MAFQGASNELVEHFFEQTREGKLSFINLMQNLAKRSSTHLPTLLFDEHQRYIQLDENHQLFEHEQMTLKKEILRDHSTLNSFLQQRTHTVASSNHTNLYHRLSDAFQIPTDILQNQYHLALKNRLEISPLLIRCLIEDARSILRLMIKDLDREHLQENDKRRQRILERLEQLEIYHRLFVEHC